MVRKLTSKRCQVCRHYVAGQLTRTLEAIARVTGEIGELARSTININGNVSILTDSPAFAKVQATMLRALAPFPDARGAEESAPVTSAAKVIDHVAA